MGCVRCRNKKGRIQEGDNVISSDVKMLLNTCGVIQSPTQLRGHVDPGPKFQKLEFMYHTLYCTLYFISYIVYCISIILYRMYVIQCMYVLCTMRICVMSERV